MEKNIIGKHNAVVGGAVSYDLPTAITFVSQESELGLIDVVKAGDFAATYGLGTLWQYDGSDWVEV